MRMSTNWMLTRAEKAGGDEGGWKEGTFIFQSWSQSHEGRTAMSPTFFQVILPYRTSPPFNYLSSSLPLIPSPHSTLPPSPYQKPSRDKGNIWQSATLPTSHPSSINGSPLSTPPQSPPCLLPCFLSPLEYLCLLWAKAWRHVSSSLERYTSSQGDMNGFNLHSCLLVLCLIRHSKELQHFHVCVLRGPCSHKKECQQHLSTKQYNSTVGDLKICHPSHLCPLFAWILDNQ